MTIATTESTITEHEAAQVERANASGATPVVFVHGLWLLPSSWDRWVTLFEEAGYVGVTPGWPDDPETVAEARSVSEYSILSALFGLKLTGGMWQVCAWQKLTGLTFLNKISSCRRT